MDLRDLRYFEAIAETGHLGQAAAKLFRTQPALTGCVRRLEATLGTALFEKVGRGIRLTAAGHALVRRARSLRVAADDTVREIAEVGAGVAGQIRIGVLPTLARFLMPPLSRAFLKDAPAVTLRTVIAQNDVLATQLMAGEVDFILTTAVRASEDLVNHRVLEDEAVVIASRNHPILARKARLADLLAYEWVLAPSSVGTRQWIDRVFQSRGLPPPHVQIETNLILMMPTLIRETELLTFTSRLHVGLTDAGADLREVKLRETTMRRRFDVAWRRGGYLSPAAERLIQLIRSRGRKLFSGD
ncbi:MAG: LysR family transcriptional regulator [Betaproteobacteria bacterium]|nr:LysR family transcriptional regulator [Betaproteobacteria bacterium]